MMNSTNGATREGDGFDTDGNSSFDGRDNDTNHDFPLGQSEDQDTSNSTRIQSSTSVFTNGRSSASAVGDTTHTEEFQLRLDLSPSFQDVNSKKRELHNIFEKFSTPILSELQKLDVRIEKRVKKLEAYHDKTTADLSTAFRQFFHAEFNPTTISSTEFPQTDEYTTHGHNMLNAFKGEMTSFILSWMEQERAFLVAKREETISKFVADAQELLKHELAKCRLDDREELGKSIQSLLQTKLNTRASTLTKVRADPLSFSTQVELVEGTPSSKLPLKRPLGNSGNSKSDGDGNHVKEKQKKGKQQATKNNNNQRPFLGQNQGRGRGRGNNNGRQHTGGRGRGNGDGRQHTGGRGERGGRF